MPTYQCRKEEDLKYTLAHLKDLVVKGANFTAKRGTSVRKISLVADNPGQIEGRVEDQRIIILTEFVKKS